MALTLWLAAVTALWILPAPGCWAGGYTYGASQRTVNAGIIENGSAHAPYVFYVLNQRSDIKPFGWNIVNPFAPASVTPAIQTRWTTYTVGQSVSQNMAAYWEVDLANMSLSQLLQYDVLYLPSAGGTSLSVASSEKLRRFVDAGGVLWVDGSTGSQTGSNLFFPVSFSSNSSDPTLNLPASGGVYARHPLLSSPYLLSEGEIASLGETQLGTFPSVAASQEQLVTVLLHTAGLKPAISAGQSGAGQIVVTGLDVAGAVNDYVGAIPGTNTGAYCGNPGTIPGSLPNFFAAPTQDLKFVSNLIASSGAHPAAQKTSHQNAASADALSSSVAPAWNWNVAGTNGGAAIYGNFVYVTDNAGTLRAFDAYPAESLLGSGYPDDGDSDYSQGTSYDQIWHIATGDTLLSAPTVAAFNGTSLVFVEDSKGVVHGYSSAAGGAAIYTLTPPASPQSGGASAFSGVAPAPTYYGGRIYAGQPDGTVFVDDLNSGASASGGQRFPITASTNPVSSPLTIGLVPDPNSGTTPTSDIVAFAATDTDVYSEFLGSRYEQLTTVGTSGANTKLNRMGLNNIKVDYASVPGPSVYDASGTSIAYGSSPPDFSFTSTATALYYGDYDVAFGSMNTSALTRTTLPLSSPDNGANVTATGTVSAPAFDSAGYAYYTASKVGSNFTSALFCVRDSPDSGGIRIRWRFRLPLASEPPITDADGVSYANLTGYQFVGSPIIDNQGFVYALATNGTSAAVLCFNTTLPIYADIADPSLNTGSPILSQPVPAGTTGGSSEFGSSYPALSLNSGTQYNLNGSRVTFTNFGLQNGGNINYLQHGLYPNLSEPEPITVTPPIDINNTTGITQGQPYIRPLHTNLVWFTAPFAISAAGASGLTKVGNTLFFSDGSSLYETTTNTAIPAGKVVATNVTAIPVTNIGTVTAAPSASNGVLVICGSGGVDTLTRQTTMVVVDNNRILEVDSHGSAVWGVDSTSSTVQQAPGGPLVTTKMDFNHPTFLSEFATDDYLVADTGNNRCVRFDRAGKVLWELTRFNDPNTLLAAGEAQTLNQPASVVVQRDYVGGSTNIHYLIADSGNSRIVEVTDSYNASGAVTQYHVLTWVSHTFDKQNRLYHYASASYYYYYDTVTKLPVGFVAALITNTRVSANAGNTGNGPASQDSSGGSMVLLSYDPSAPTTSMTNGYITTTTVSAAVPPPPAVTTTFGVGATKYQITNPRFLQIYTPSSGNDSILFADDNGAFDLTYDTVNKIFVATNLAFLAGKPTDTPNTSYHSMSWNINTGVLPGRSTMPFEPSCVQRLGNNGTGPRYLITQTYGQAELGDPSTSKIGGEVFEVASGVASGGFGADPNPPYNPRTLSRPALTGPLTQPTFAIRP